MICLRSASLLASNLSINQPNTYSMSLLFGMRFEDILIFFLSGDSDITTVSDVLKHKLFIIVRRCNGPEVAVKASTGTLGQMARSSPLWLKCSLKASWCLFPSPLYYKQTRYKINLVLISHKKYYRLRFYQQTKYPTQRIITCIIFNKCS